MTSADLVDRAQNGVVEEPNPSARPKRRTFTAAEKAAYLDAYDALPKGSDQRGAFLRREGLYSSHLSEWRKQRDQASAAGLGPKQRRSKRTADQVEFLWSLPEKVLFLRYQCAVQ